MQGNRGNTLIRGPRLSGAITFGLIVCASFFLQCFVSSAGRWTLDLRDLPTRYTTTLYGEQAQAFLNGSTALLRRPSAELLALPDPYDPIARRGIESQHDASLYEGKYFLYFGPGPALVLLPFQLVNGSAPLPDSGLALGFSFVTTMALTGLLLLLRARLFPGLPAWLAGVVILGFVAGAPVLFTLARPAVYEAAIFGGQAGLFTGLFCGLLAVFGVRPAFSSTMAGASFAFALSSRITLIPAVVLSCVFFAVTLFQRRSSNRALAFCLVGLTVPPLLALAGLGAFNGARFGSPLETGHRYQLTLFPLMAEYDRFFSLDYFGANLFSSFLRPPEVTPVFPFVEAPDTSLSSLPGWIAPSRFLILEPTIGLFLANPLLFFAMPAAAIALFQAARGSRVAPYPAFPIAVSAAPAAARAGDSPLKDSANQEDVPAEYARIAIFFAALVALLAIPDLLQRYTTMRYLLDFSPALGALGFMAVGWAYVRVGKDAQRAKPVLAGALVLLSMVSLAVSVLGGFQGYYRHFQTHNPPLFAALARPSIPASASDLSTSGKREVRRLNAVFAGIGTLDSVELPGGFVDAGQHVVAVLRWKDLQESAAGVETRLLQSGYRPVGTSASSLGRASGDYEQVLSLQIPEHLEGPEFLFVEIKAAGPGQDAALIRDASGRVAGDSLLVGPIHLRTNRAFPPSGATRSDVWLGVEMRLAGIEIGEPSQSGDGKASLPVVLYWTAPPYRDRIVDRRLVRLIVEDQAGTRIGEVSGEPGEGWFSTVNWIPGDAVVDDWDIPLDRPIDRRELRVRVQVEAAFGGIDPLGSPEFVVGVP